MRAWLLVPMLAALTGCVGMMGGPPQPEVVSFPKAPFAYALGKHSQGLAHDCKEGRLTKERCAALKVSEEVLLKQLFAPPSPTPSGIDIEMLLKVLGKAADIAL